jgi:signal peptidase I
MSDHIGDEQQVNAEPPAAPPPPWWQRILIGRRPKRTLVRLCLLVVACLFLFSVVLLPIRVEGISMDPTYRDRQINFINRWAYRITLVPAVWDGQGQFLSRLSVNWRHIQRGDVVGIRYSGPHVMLLKRIIGLPGERIAIKRGIVFIDGKALAEPYIRKPMARWWEPEITLKANQYFIIGDNREMPGPSHVHGPIDGQRIVGKILF